MPIDSAQHPFAHVQQAAAEDLTAWNVGAHLVQGFAGTKPTDPGVQDLKRRAEAGELGGVIFFSYNVTGQDQLRALTHYVASWEVPKKNQPLLLMVDQEGGYVQRLRPSQGFHGWPAPQILGQISATQAKASFAGLAQELACAGFNMNLAPSVDLWAPRNGLIGAHGRSFGMQPAQVTERARWQMQAQRRAGIASVVKHFPGHGLSRGDTHAGAVDATRAWHPRELIPFANLIALGELDAMMSAHLVHRELEPSGAPLTFSRNLLQARLRDQMHYDGVLMTDDLGMGAIVQRYSVEESVVGALGSSHDLLLFGLNEAALGRGRERYSAIPDLAERASRAVQAALGAGNLTPELLRLSDARLAAFRRKLGRGKAVCASAPPGPRAAKPSAAAHGHAGRKKRPAKARR